MDGYVYGVFNPCVMALIDNAKTIQDLTGISKSASVKAFIYQKRAERLLREKLTDTVYDDLEQALPDDADAGLAKQAEAFLALHYSLTPLNLRVADNGGLLRLVGHGDYQEELMSPQQLDRVKAQIYNMAMDLIGDLLPSANPDDQFAGNGFGITVI